MIFRTAASLCVHFVSPQSHRRSIIEKKLKNSKEKLAIKTNQMIALIPTDCVRIEWKIEN